jgi:hypothetical protein
MSKENNLTDFLTDVADAIREKKGSSEKINPQNFSEEIKNLPSGGEEVNTFGEVMVDKTGGGVKQLLKVVVDDSVTTIGANAYYYCNTVTEFVLHDGINSIGISAFQRCEKIKSITIPPLVTELRNNLCSGCVDLENVAIHDNVESIGQYCFQLCVKLRHLSFPAKLKSIGNFAFQNCTGLLVCDFLKSLQVPTLNNINAFSTANAECLFVVPDNLYDEWIAATNWSTYADRIVKASEYQPNNE